MPHDGNIDYGGYSIDELEEVLDTIDRDRYPVNFARLESELAARRVASPQEMPAPEPGLAPEPAAADSEREKAKVAPIGTLITGLVFGVALLIYGAVGLVHDDILLPGRHRSLHFHGWAAWLLYGAFVIAFAVNISGLLDHRARLFRPPRYHRFRTACTVALMILIVVSVFGASFR